MLFKAIGADLQPRFDRGHHPDGDENNCRDHVDNFRRQALCKAITEVHGGRIGHHHAQGRAQNHGQHVRVLRRQGDGCKLRFIAHLRQKKCDHCGKKHTHLLFWHGNIILIQFVRHQILQFYILILPSF